jgi:hypothetical protein
MYMSATFIRLDAFQFSHQSKFQATIEPLLAHGLEARKLKAHSAMVYYLFTMLS